MQLAAEHTQTVQRTNDVRADPAHELYVSLGVAVARVRDAMAREPLKTIDVEVGMASRRRIFIHDTGARTRDNDSFYATRFLAGFLAVAARVVRPPHGRHIIAPGHRVPTAIECSMLGAPALHAKIASAISWWWWWWR